MMTMDAALQGPWVRRALPPFAVVTDRATRVAQRAEELARAGREDEAAVAGLLELARGRRRTLAEAAQLLRTDGEHLEIRRRNRAVRLLTAAVTGYPIQPEPADVSARLDMLEGLASLPPRLAFEVLAAREPRLLALHDKLIGSRARANDDSDFTRWLRLSGVIHHDLVELLGHGRREFDPLCSAVIAYAIASAYLADFAVTC
jgi:hypothetical protein